MKRNKDDYRHNNDFSPKQSSHRAHQRKQKQSIKRLGKVIKDKIWWGCLDYDQKIRVLSKYRSIDLYHTQTQNGFDFLMEQFEKDAKKTISNKKYERLIKINSLLNE